ncbi:MAG: hypothetical protein ABGY75_03340 [Gemmataceae bacterium]
MKKPDFQLKVESNDSHLSLASVSAKEVAQLISTITDIIETAATESDGEPFGVSLAGVSERSIFISQHLSERCRLAVSVILSAIATGDFSRVPADAHGKLVTFSRQLVGQGRFARLSGAGGPEVEISASHPIPEFTPKLVKHKTTLYGKVVWAGGIRTYKAIISLNNAGRSIEVQVESAELVKQLAAKMYEVVGIRGTAWTDLRSEKMTDFRAESITRYRGNLADPIAALNEMATQHPDVWAGVDVPALISKMRDDEGSQP